MTPPPRSRWAYATRCTCGRVLLGRARHGGRGRRKYLRHWKTDHGSQR